MAKERSYKAFWAIINKMPRADKEVIVRQYTGGRTTSLNEMTDKEYQRMIGALNHSDGEVQKLKNARSSALKQLQRYGVDTNNWVEINRFVSQPKICGKLFYSLTIPELVGLTSKMRAIIDKGKRKAMQDEIDKYNQQAAAAACHNQRPS